MGSNNSSSSSSSPPDTNSDCYFHNRIKQQHEQCLQSHSNNIGNTNSPIQMKSTICSNKIQIGCDCQGNIVECDENGKIIRSLKQNNNNR